MLFLSDLTQVLTTEMMLTLPLRENISYEGGKQNSHRNFSVLPGGSGF